MSSRRALASHLFFWRMGIRCCVRFVFSSRRRHTRCLSDWSSDVCSSDLKAAAETAREDVVLGPILGELRGLLLGLPLLAQVEVVLEGVDVLLLVRRVVLVGRSEERRVGKECRSRWRMAHYQGGGMDGRVY